MAHPLDDGGRRTAVAKAKKNDDRRARLEAMRREAERAERRRTMAVVAVCAVVGLAIIGATGYYLLTQEESAATAGETVDGGSLGGAATTAGCDNIVLRAAEGSNDHVTEPVDYPYPPPAFGPHWVEPAPPGTTFYTVDNRPEVERLVHNLEHGYTVLWYDQTIADDPDVLAQVQSIAEPLAGRQDPSGKFIAAPWTSADGDAFPEGKHVALTHWSAQGEAAIPQQGQGDWLFCAEPSADVVSDFMAKFPPSDALEPNAP
jgi:hypothetical protein